MTFAQQHFRDTFQPEAFRVFRSAYEGINPDRPLETAGIAFGDTEPLFRNFLEPSSATDAFVDQFLPQLGTFLQGPFPLPGKRVTRSAWDCRGKTGAYQACGLTPQAVAGKRTLDVGCNAGYDTFLVNAMGAAQCGATRQLRSDHLSGPHLPPQRTHGTDSDSCFPDEAGRPTGHGDPCAVRTKLSGPFRRGRFLGRPDLLVDFR